KHDPSVDNPQPDVVAVRFHRQDDFAGFSIFDGIIDRLLGNAIQMRSYCIVRYKYWLLAFKTALDVEQLGNRCCQFLESRHQSVSLNAHRRKSARQHPRLRARLAHMLSYPAGLACARLSLLSKVLFSYLAHQL